MPLHQALRRPGPEFDIREDQDSIQISTPADRMFWLRVLRPVETTRLTITDFKRGDLGDDELVEVLRLAFEMAGDGVYLSGIDFLDLVPSKRREPDAAEYAGHEAATILDLLAMAAEPVGLTIHRSSLEGRRGKFILMIEARLRPS